LGIGDWGFGGWAKTPNPKDQKPKHKTPTPKNNKN